MKRTFFSMLTASGIFMLCFASCKKEQDFTYYSESAAIRTPEANGVTAAATLDRIDEIVKDLATSNYSLSFSKTYSSYGITRTAYGSASYLAFVSPDAVKLPSELRNIQKYVPIWKRPNFILPTCPDMIFDPLRLQKVRELLAKADPAQFSGLREVAFVNGGGFLATDKVLGQYANLKTDVMDGLLKDLGGAKFLILNEPGTLNREFGRSFYGYANINDIVFKPYRKNWKDIFKPTLKGCYDPIILSVIKERLAKINPAAYGGLNVTTLAENKNIAIMY
ncbi:hypothetical protein [Foetidibacter luteolus]|uniref:hypothetical protein n=1 Tax=Foetidibacter luteolus TaxID=2608880 RepID=UPI00129AD04C|nr:hypothetical protein [Foetidibacter luteolus]